MFILYFHKFLAFHWCCEEKSFISANMKRAPFFESEIVLFTKSFVLSRFAAGDPAPELKVSLSPPTVILAQYGSVFNGL